jgi:hypothetical protein
MGQILLLDNFKAPVLHMESALGIEIKLVDSVEDARAHLIEEDQGYDALIVEPFIYHKRLDQIDELHDLMISAINVHQLPVIAYSTQSEDEMGIIYSLKEGVHYDAFVTKWSCLNKYLKNTLDSLLNHS